MVENDGLGFDGVYYIQGHGGGGGGWRSWKKKNMKIGQNNAQCPHPTPFPDLLLFILKMYFIQAPLRMQHDIVDVTFCSAIDDHCIFSTALCKM